MNDLFKILLTFCLLVAISLRGEAQENLVPNGSFEDTTYCVTSSADVYASLGWESFANTPDYFNTCTSNGDVSVPNNWGGYQQPASGNAYCALGAYCTDCDIPNLREFIGRALSTPLSVGTKYYVSIKVNLSISSTIWVNCATNNIGAGFTTNPYHWSTNWLSANNNPKVYCDSIIVDTLNWTTIFGSFTADSAYQYIVLGNLFDDSNTDTLIIDAGANPTGNCSAYYFIDDVCVSTDSSYAANYIYTGIQEESLKDNFNIYPNPITNNHFQINQAFAEPYDLTIYNALGQQLYQENNITTSNKVINTMQFTKGVLFITIKSNSKLINYKLVKQ